MFTNTESLKQTII